MAENASTPFTSPLSILRRSRFAAVLSPQQPANILNRSNASVQTSPSTKPNTALLNRLEELEVALDTAHAVNKHLNSEVEGLVMELDKLRRDKQQYERHIEELAALLHKEKHKTAALVAQVRARGSDSSATLATTRLSSEGALSALTSSPTGQTTPLSPQFAHSPTHDTGSPHEGPLGGAGRDSAQFGSMQHSRASSTVEMQEGGPAGPHQGPPRPTADDTDMQDVSPSYSVQQGSATAGILGGHDEQHAAALLDMADDSAESLQPAAVEPTSAGAFEGAIGAETAHSRDAVMQDLLQLNGGAEQSTVDDTAQQQHSVAGLQQEHIQEHQYAAAQPQPHDLAQPQHDAAVQQHHDTATGLAGAQEGALFSGITSSSASAADTWQMVDEASSMPAATANIGDIYAQGDASSSGTTQADTVHSQGGQHMPKAHHSAASFVPPPLPTGDGMEWAHDARWEHLRHEALAAGWLISPEELQLGPQVGEGAFGTSFKGTWRGVTVAVKCVRVSTMTEAETFVREVELLASLRHPNLLPFYGACLWPLQHCWLVTEFMEGGTLQAWLYGGPNKQGTILQPQRSLYDRLHMALDVAKGMEALEESDPQIVHRDLKPSNIFIDAAGRARVADFGLGRRLLPGYAADLTGETGTYAYMSPEMMRHELYDSKTDVYSWGIMLVELVLQRGPFDKLYLSPVQIALAVAEGKLHAADLLPANTNATVAALAAMCLDHEPELRPTFGLIVQELTMAMEEVKQHQASASQKGAFGRFFSRRGPEGGKEN